jgi:hypothetical protein
MLDFASKAADIDHREGAASKVPRSTTRAGGVLGYVSAVWLMFVWTPRLWFWFFDPAKLQEPDMQTPTWVALLSIALAIIFLSLVKSTWALINEALEL